MPFSNRIIPLGDSPRSIVIGDFDNDGSRDLAIANEASQDIAVLMGLGNGEFVLQDRYAAGESPQDLVVADFDGDGRLDLAVLDAGAPAVGVFSGASGGVFNPVQWRPIEDSPTDLLVGDVNRDSRDDLIVVSSISNLILVLLGEGDGEFSALPSFSVGNQPSMIASAVIDDINRDSIPDLIAWGEQQWVGMLGNGDGTFRLLLPFSDQVGFLTTGDFDLDGKLDVYFLSSFSGGCFSIAYGSGDGSFDPWKLGQPCVAQLPQSYGAFETTDLNNDGSRDLVGISEEESTAAVLFDLMIEGPRTEYEVRHLPISSASDDFNQDGFVDLVVLNSGSDDLSILFGMGDGTFLAPRKAPRISAGDYPVTLVKGYIDGGSVIDLAIGNRESRDVRLFLGDARGSFTTLSQVQLGDEIYRMASGDLNADAVSDFMVLTASFDIFGSLQTSLLVLVSTASGLYLPTQELAFGGPPVDVALGVLDSDAQLDLVVLTSASFTRDEAELHLLRGQADGTFLEVVSILAPATVRSLLVDDVNGDGLDDVVLAGGESGEIVLLRNQPGWQFTSAINISAGLSPAAVASADLNGDGLRDLAVSDEVADQVGLFLGQSDGSFLLTGWFSTGSCPRAVSIVSLRSLEVKDVIVTNSCSADISVIFGNAAGGFESEVRFGVGVSPNSLVSGDFDLDGRADLAVANAVSGDLSILVNSGEFPPYLDDDRDGIVNPSDNCPLDDNTDQRDLDSDGTGDVCDSDRDGDGLSNDLEVGLGTNPDDADSDDDMLDDGSEVSIYRTDPLKEDTDGDGLLDGAEVLTYRTSPLLADTDGDGLSDGIEVALGTDPLRRDTDGDGVSDAEDNCALVSNPEQKDLDGDGEGDNCDLDDDNDGVSDESDNCPLRANSDQGDFDQDGIGNSCELGALLADIDNSGRVDGFDLARLGRAFGTATMNGDYDPRSDLDRNGTVDGIDLAIFADSFGAISVQVQ